MRNYGMCKDSRGITVYYLTWLGRTVVYRSKNYRDALIVFNHLTGSYFYDDLMGGLNLFEFAAASTNTPLEDVMRNWQRQSSRITHGDCVNNDCDLCSLKEMLSNYKHYCDEKKDLKRLPELLKDVRL